ncbi:DNA double-strand break repair nuclease NurA [Candidatus Bathyarchaeota archaeon]|nr:MAG: DNA double-strand break repair nuclease NurA [Candidatus Bathyarchaeota archaeon]
MLTLKRGFSARLDPGSAGEVGGGLSTHPDLCLAIRNLVLGEITKDVYADLEAVAGIAEKIRAGAEIMEISRREHFTRVTGIDAGGQRLPLSSRWYAVISALAYSLPEGRCFFTEPESIKFSYRLSNLKFKSILSVRREAKLYETGIKFLERNPDVELILIDGPLAFSNWWRAAGRPVDRRALVDRVNRFLHLCQEREVLVAGIVKRPSARYLLYHLGLQEATNLPDSFILLQVLRPGERTGLFSPRSALRRVVRSSPFMDAIGFPIYSFYARLSRDWSIPPIRIDLPAFSLGYVEEIAEYCYATSYLQGVPLPVIKADESVRISKEFIDEVYLEVLSRVGRETGELSYVAPVWGEGRWMGMR